MDPDTLLILAGLGLSISPFIIKNAFFAAADKIIEKKEHDKIMKPIKENVYYEAHPELKSKEEQELAKLTTRKVAEPVYFKSVSTRKTKKFSLFRTNLFDDKEDILIHGKLKTIGNYGKVHVEDIYAYQPRLYGKNGVILGPRKSENGNILSEGTYACRDNGEIFCGYVPKREVASNVPMDFDIKSPHSFAERFPEQRSLPEEEAKENIKIQRFIQVEWDKDAQGNFKVVDLKNEQEFKKYAAYVDFHAKRNSAEYYLSKIRTARSKLYQYLKDTRPSYMPPVEIGTDDLFKVNESKQLDIEKQNAEKLSKLYDLFYDEARFGITPRGSRPNFTYETGHMGGPGPGPGGPGPKR